MLNSRERTSSDKNSPDPQAVGQAPPGWIRRLARYCLRHPVLFGFAFGGALIGMAANAITPLIVREVVDDVILTQVQPMLPWIIALLTVGVANFGGGFLRRFLGGRLSIDVQHDLRREVFASLERMDGKKQDELPPGQIVSRSISDLNLVQGLLGMMPIMISNVLLFFGSVIIMFTLSAPLTVVALLVGPVLWFIAIRGRRTLFPANWDAQQRVGEVAGVVESAVTGVRVVKGFGQEQQELDRLDGAAQNLYASRTRTIRLNSFYNPLMQAIPAFGQVGILGVGGWMALDGQITLGTFLAFSTYLASMVAPVRMLSGLLTIGQQAKAGVLRVFEVIDAKPDIEDAPDATTLPDGPVDVRFDRVSFGYTEDQPVLDEVSFTVQRGETLALVGTAGSGKSTVSLLLPRFYDVGGGSICVGGTDIREVTLESLRGSIGMVFEDSFLFSTTVRDNLAYGRPDATQDEIEAAARAAEAHEFISKLPKGYDTVVGEQGLTLSGGQRQRVALARALLTDPQVLLLDDATSAIDARIEAEIHNTLRRVMAGRTVILVAHRRSTLELADRIGVLDRGRLVDIGTHEELTARCDLYNILLTGPEDIDRLDPDQVSAEADGRPMIINPALNGQELNGSMALEAQVDGVTPSAWREPELTPEEQALERAYGLAELTSGMPGGGGMGGGGMGMRGGGGRGMGPMGSMVGALPPSPELLAQVAKLPPATDRPRVDPEHYHRPDPAFRFIKLLRIFRAPLLLGLILVAADALAQLILPAAIRLGVDQGVTEDRGDVIIIAAVLAFVVTLADWLVQRAQSQVTGRNGERILYLLRMKLFAHLQRLGLDFYEREMGGRIMTRMTTDVDALSTFVQTGLTTAVVSLLSFFGVLVAILVINPSLALVVLAVLPLVIIATLIFRARSSRAYQISRERISIVNADLQENVAGVRVTQAFRREAHNAQRFGELSESYRVARVRSQRYIATFFPFIAFVSDLATALVLLFGATQVHNGALTAGGLIAFMLYVTMFFSPVQQLSQVFDSYQQAAVGLRRISELLRTKPSTPEAAQPTPAPDRMKGEIVFDDVIFSYRGSEEPALREISFRIPSGQRVAVVGETGAGKSTVMKLLARFYDPSDGEVRVDQVDLRSYDLAGYRHRLGYVPQEAYLFSGTVADAIKYGRPDASRAEVEAAAQAVGAHEMIAGLKNGYHHQVGDRGRNLSAGQRQLIALARAECVQPDLLLLDEATAALDLASEAAVTRAADRLAERRTTVVIAHRLTTAARADRILVLDHGEVVEDGSHAELLERDGAYRRLWQAFAGDLVDAPSR
ncbi:ABC transporter ATP-binding protein [Microlunatus speluncae]|uniref:ABC transporter ATP-binding protein n=1 Tax=Microlunatus speluncae TaxID=2594267 RepID=UPI001266540A|nr:ABC transporter ATP-binding protein [Microlunatus speluncae]